MQETNKNKRKKKKNITKTNVVMIGTLVVIIVFFIVNAIKNKDLLALRDISKQTEAEKLLEKDIQGKYPGTTREVIKLYNRILKCIYNDKLSEEQLDGLCGQMRLLFDEELLKSNPKETQLEQLKADIEEYKKDKKSISSYDVQKNSEVEKNTIDKQEYASILASYLVKQKSNLIKSYQQFMLRQDKDKNWRILGWKSVEPVEIEEE